MSRGARWVLGTAAVFFALVLVFAEHTAASNAPWLNYSVAVFCLLISVACFSARLRGPAVRVIGAAVFVAYASYLISELTAKAVFGFAVFGLAGLYVAVRGRLPFFGQGSGGLKPDEENKPES